MTHHVNAAFTGRAASRVRGTAFEVTDAEIAIADTYEQRAAYTRRHVTLASGRPAWVYGGRPVCARPIVNTERWPRSRAPFWSSRVTAGPGALW